MKTALAYSSGDVHVPKVVNYAVTLLLYVREGKEQGKRVAEGSLSDPKRNSRWQENQYDYVDVGMDEDTFYHRR